MNDTKNDNLRQSVLSTITKRYKQEDCLEEVHGNIDQAGQTTLKATFSLMGQETTCEVKQNKQGMIQQATCNCRWYAEYGNCPHVQILHAHAKQIRSYPYVYQNKALLKLKETVHSYKQRKAALQYQASAQKNRYFIQNMIQTYEKQLSSQVQSMEYDIEPVIVESGYGFDISFKVGKAQKYVIKSIEEFLRQVDTHQEVKYGKNLSFVHKEESFSEQARKLIQLMRRYYNREDGSPKLIALQGGFLDEFFAHYEQEDDENTSFVCLSDGFDVNVEIRHENDYYMIHLDEYAEFYCGKRNIYEIEYVDKDSCLITQLLLDDAGITASLLDRLKNEDMIISEADYPKFYKYVLLTAMKYVNLSLPETLTESVMERAELYGDIDEKNRIFFYLYCYDEGNRRFAGFDDTRITCYEQDMIEAYISQYAKNIDDKEHRAYFDMDADITLDFISEGLPYLSAYCDIYVSEDLKRLGHSRSYQISVGVKVSNGFLDLVIQSPEMPKDEIQEILSAYKRKKKFYRLKNGTLLSLESEDLEKLTNFLDLHHINYQDLRKGKVQVEPYRMFSIDQCAKKEDYVPINPEKSFATYLQKYYEAKPIKIPVHYENILRDYQKEGVQWLSTMRHYGFHSILADDMGLGKTLQVITLLETHHSGQCSLVVCPSSLVYNWEEEVHKFSKQLSMICVSGTQEQRCEKIKQASSVNLLVTSYDYLRRDIELYQEIQFDTVILDEAQYIKNHKSKNAISVKQLQAQHRIALTGTPIENSLAELWSIFDFLMPGYLFTYHYFQKHYETAIVKNHDPNKQAELRQMVSPFILRRNKKDVLKELPEKIEIVRMIEFNEEERRLYQANVSQLQQDLSLMKEDKQLKIKVLGMLMKLRQLCCEPRLLYENINGISSKLADCMDLIEEIHENQQKVLLFSTFTTTLDLLAEELRRKQISYYMLTGSTSKEQRKDLVKRFQEDDTCVFLISLKAGGTGLNLTAAQAVIHFDPWWNVSQQNQATDRAYRIGQERNVQVFQLIMKDSIEERIMNLQKQKKELADAFVENNEGAITKMSKEEIMALFANS